MKHGPGFRDLTGQRFGKLVAFEHFYERPYSKWKLLCDCGEIAIGTSTDILRGNHTRCTKCAKKKRGLVHYKHGHCQNGKSSKTYKAWNSAKRRTTNPKSGNWYLYGGRGIIMCERWLNSFDAFLSDMGECPRGLTLERVDVNGNYEPSNCIWDTPKNQQNNQRTNVRLTYNGVTKTLSRWADQVNIHIETLRGRLRQGWSVERVLTQPLQIHNRKPF